MVKPINFIVPLVVYPFDVMVSINETDDSFAKNVVRSFGSDILEDFNKFTHPMGNGLSYVYTSEKKLACVLRVYSFKKDSNGYSDLQHEIFHCAEFVLRTCGVELNSNSHEAYAYLIGYLTKEIYKKI